jgi:hypothetical protein
LRCSVPSWLAPWCDARTIDGARHLSTNHRTRCATLGKRRVTAAPGLSTLSPVVSNGQGASASLPMPMRRNFASEISSRLGPLGARYPNGGISDVEGHATIAISSGSTGASDARLPALPRELVSFHQLASATATGSRAVRRCAIS